MGLGSMLAGAVKAAAAAAKASKSSSGGSSSGSFSGSSGSSGSSSSGSSGASMAATGKGGSYSIGSDKGKNFVSSAAAGSTMTGSDGSTWKKNSDGTTTISKGGQTFTYGGASGTGGSGGGSSGSGTYTPLGSHNDQTIKDTSVEDSAQMAAIKKRYAEAQARGDTAAMKSAHADAEALRAQYGYSGGSDGSDYIGKGYVSGNVLGKQMSNQLNSGFDAYKKYMEDAAAQQQAALKAKVDSAVASLNGQKYDVMKQTEANNAAAEKAYMQSIKPGGSNAENLAANGLLTSGLTESSQISAGNAYQNALNSNATTQTETLAKIEQAITQAQLTGDIEAANALANLYKEIAAKRYENTQNIVSANQWGQQFGLSQAEQTGTYNGQATLAAQQLEMQKRQLQEDIENGKVDRQTALKQIEYINAQIAYMQAQTTGQNLSNKYSQWQLNQL
ncbi:hypothetical protein DWZ82_07830 [Butyricicoccus sp. AF35-5AC]|uniref:hypothetical protein n=1 Tax=Butyricicoccus sp. AF35-5AC TaxID=2292003 RepID=UPI000E476B93|nr:hypothetical protein [Butyricicoccus sp. AF35-5AC]RHP15261.1 hypothetical protein DWZ82_07830 [Butyricicoccus sp. AF35-5AC]